MDPARDVCRRGAPVHVVKVVLFNGTLSRLQYPPDEKVLPPCAVCGDYSARGYWLQPLKKWRLAGLCKLHDRVFRGSAEFLRLKLNTSYSPISAIAFMDFVRRIQAEEENG